MSLLERWALQLVFAFVIRQLKKFGKEIDWALVKADAAARAAALCPIDWFDDEMARFAGFLVDGCEAAVKSTSDVQDVLDRLAGKDWAGALDELKDLVLKAWKPTDAGAQKAFAAVEQYGAAAAA